MIVVVSLPGSGGGGLWVVDDQNVVQEKNHSLLLTTRVRHEALVGCDFTITARTKPTNIRK